MNIINRDKQQGAALIISLMMLLVLTMVGVSALSNTSLGERMARNFQHFTLAFQASESAIERIIISGDPGGAGANSNPFYSVANDPLVTSLNAGINDSSTIVTAEMDPGDFLKNTTLDTSAIVIYRGNSACPETSFEELNCYVFEIQSTASTTATSTTTTHVQSIERPAPGVPS
ncbi:MAG: hypothetical protein GXP08_15805 [Gammaproteobacteria bacterium]|nr:hypothetical protein [Gammaproteobacteria bacterium]